MCVVSRMRSARVIARIPIEGSRARRWAAYAQRYREMLGHASVTITLDLYSHVLPDMQQVATAAMDAVLGG